MLLLRIAQNCIVTIFIFTINFLKLICTIVLSNLCFIHIYSHLFSLFEVY